MQWLGYTGTGLVVVAYLPQITHLIRARCSAGISLRAYLLWALASSLLLAYAISLGDAVFIALNGWSMLATCVILGFSLHFRGST